MGAQWGWEFIEHEKMKLVRERMLTLLLQEITVYEAVDCLINEFYSDEWALYCLSHLLISERGKIHDELRFICLERLEISVDSASYDFDEDDEDDYDPIVFIELKDKILSADNLKE